MRPRTSDAWHSAACTTARSPRASRWRGAVPTVRPSGSRSPSCLITEALDRVPAESASPGDIIAVAGIPEITIGETLTDAEDPRPLPVITVDEPSISMTIGINTAPLSGQSGKKLTARMVKTRLEAELIGNVSIRVAETERPDTWEVQGRGELQLAVLVEMMRREGFELTVGKPQVVTREVDGKVHEPVERLTVDIPEDYLGRGDAAHGAAQGSHGADGQPRHRVGAYGVPGSGPRHDRLPHRVPHRDRGTGLLHHVFERYEPWHGELRTRPTGSLVADRRGDTTGFALANLQERGTMFVGPGTEVYEGMIVGENSRSDDMDVNPTKEKKLTNMRQSSGDILVPLIPHKQLSMEQALEFCREDECVEVTPATVRLRKVVLDQNERNRDAGRGPSVSPSRSARDRLRKSTWSVSRFSATSSWVAIWVMPVSGSTSCGRPCSASTCDS